MAGRPAIELTPEMIGIAREVLENGGTYLMVAEACGMGRSLFQEWLARGRLGEKPYADLVDACYKAKSKAKLRALKTIRKAIEGFDGKDGEWQPAAWWLQRRCPEDFGNKTMFSDMSSDEKITRVLPGDVEATVEGLMNAALERGDLSASKDALEMLKTLNPSKWNAPPTPPADADPTVLQVPTPSPEF